MATDPFCPSPTARMERIDQLINMSGKALLYDLMDLI